MPKKTLKGLSIREFAKRDGCSPTLVRRKVETGHLSSFEDGSIDPKHVGTPWRRSSPEGAHTPAVRTPETVRTPPAVRTPRRASKSGPAPAAEIPAEPEAEALGEVAARVLAGMGVDGSTLLTTAEAERLKENCLARLREIDLEKARGNLVDRAAAEAWTFAQARAIRDAWMQWPLRIAPDLAAELRAPEAQVLAALQRFVRAHLLALEDAPVDPLAP